MALRQHGKDAGKLESPFLSSRNVACAGREPIAPDTQVPPPPPASVMKAGSDMSSVNGADGKKGKRRMIAFAMIAIHVFGQGAQR